MAIWAYGSLRSHLMTRWQQPDFRRNDIFSQPIKTLHDCRTQTGSTPERIVCVLFFTEMWERFGYYLMLGIFSLYMLDSLENGGMGFSGAKNLTSTVPI